MALFPAGKLLGWLTKLQCERSCAEGVGLWDSLRQKGTLCGCICPLAGASLSFTPSGVTWGCPDRLLCLSGGLSEQRAECL